METAALRAAQLLRTAAGQEREMIVAWHRPTLPHPPIKPVLPTILLVDDEPMIRELGQSIPEAQGWQVLHAEDGAQALDIYRQQRVDRPDHP